MSNAFIDLLRYTTQISIEMSTYHDIVDYRKTDSHAQWKLRSPDVEDFKLVIGNLVYIIDKMIIKLSNYNTLVPHWLQYDIVQEVKGGVSLASLNSIRSTDGIYDNLVASHI